MLRSAYGEDILAASLDAVVNPVNTVGVMGKGLAFQFKNRFPENFKAYNAACSKGDIVEGKVHVFETGETIPRIIVNFPTKAHWRDPSRLEYIRDGLTSLVGAIQVFDIKSIGIPPLGCGLGGLKWCDVKPMIEQVVFALPPRISVVIFEPS